MALVRAACPHDCPDTCAMLVTVEDGRATHGRRRPRPPDHRRASCAARSRTTSTASTPRTACCTRWSAPAPKGDGEFRQASWDEALDRVAAGLAGDRAPRRRVDPALQLLGHPGPDPGRRDERARDERARRQRARAHDLRDGRHAGTARHARPLARGRSRAVAARALRARLGLEPDVDRAAPLAQAARRARRRGAARRRRSVPQPHGARRRRAPAAAAGHRRRARARDDARGRRRRPPGRGVVPRAHRRLRRAARPPRRLPGRALRRDLRRAGRATSRASACEFAPTRPRCCGSASAPSATWARPSPTARSPACPRWSAPGATAAAAAPTSRRRPPPRSARVRAGARRPAAAARCARSTCRSSATR